MEGTEHRKRTQGTEYGMIGKCHFKNSVVKRKTSWLCSVCSTGSQNLYSLDCSLQISSWRRIKKGERHGKNLKCHSHFVILFIVTEKERDKERKWHGVGVMKDKELKIEDVKVSHTLGWVSYIVHSISIHRFHRRSRKSLGGRVVETDEPEWKWERGAWSRCEPC